MIEGWITRWGYLALVFGTFFEGEAVLILAGALAHKGLLSFPLVVLAAFLGSVTGDQLWFHVGRRFGRPLLKRRPAWRILGALLCGALAAWGGRRWKARAEASSQRASI